MRRGCRRPAVWRLRLRTLQEPQIERRKYQDNPDVHDQPIPELVPEEQDVHADHDGYHREHVKRDGYPVSHRSILVSTMPARLTCRPPLIRALASAATEGWHPCQIGGYACPPGAMPAARQDLKVRVDLAVLDNICTASGRRERPHVPR